MNIYHFLVFFFSFPAFTVGQQVLPDSICCEYIEKVENTSNLKQLRLSRNLNIAQVADSLNITVKEYYLLETRGIWPDKTILNELIKLLDCGVAFDKDRKTFLKSKDAN
jgi:hypothetical protein